MCVCQSCVHVEDSVTYFDHITILILKKFVTASLACVDTSTPGYDYIVCESVPLLSQASNVVEIFGGLISTQDYCTTNAVVNRQ